MRKGPLVFKKAVIVGLFFVSHVMGTGGASGADLPCTVCAGVQVGDLTTSLEWLANAPKIGEDDTLFLAWTVRLDGTEDMDSIDVVRRAGAKPWMRAVFRTPQPIAENLDRFESELEELAVLARGGGEGLFVQAVWLPNEGPIDVRDHAFLIKRAAVAVTGASLGAKFIAGPLEADPESLRALYREEVAAYLDLIALAPGDNLTTAVATLAESRPREAGRTRRVADIWGAGEDCRPGGRVRCRRVRGHLL